MMCFLYDEQFPVLPDIIQISGPDQAEYHIISDTISGGDEPRILLANLLLHILFILYFIFCRDF